MNQVSILQKFMQQNGWTIEGLSYSIEVAGMSMVTSPVSIDCYFQESMVTAIELSAQGEKLAIGRVDGTLSIHDVGTLSSYFDHGFESKIIGLRFQNDDLKIVTESGDIWLYSEDKLNLLENVENGIISAHIDSSIVCLDNLEHLHVFSVGQKSCLGEYTQFSKSLTGILAANSEGVVVNYSPSGEVIWKRDSLDVHGDQITCLEHSGNFQIIAREGSSVSELPSYQVEIYNESGIIHSIDFTRPIVCARILNHFREDYFAVVGDFDGQLYTISENGEKSKLCKLKYPAKHIIDLVDGIMVASWFNLNCLDYSSGEILWTVEHLGITEYVSVSTDRSVIAFAGEDQNDWTGSEPVGVIDLEKGLTELDKSELTLWASKEKTPDYENQESIYENLDEDLSMGGDDVSEFTVDSVSDALMNALNSELSADIDTTEEDDFSLDDLLSDISAEDTQKVQPQAVVSDDISVVSGQDGSAIVLLDGSNSIDPDRQIITWRWLDSNGNEIASTSKAKVKLNKGSYRFTLEVYDKEHRMSSDSLSVIIR